MVRSFERRCVTAARRKTTVLSGIPGHGRTARTYPFGASPRKGRTFELGLAQSTFSAEDRFLALPARS